MCVCVCVCVRACVRVCVCVCNFDITLDSCRKLPCVFFFFCFFQCMLTPSAVEVDGNTTKAPAICLWMKKGHFLKRKATACSTTPTSLKSRLSVRIVGFSILSEARGFLKFGLVCMISNKTGRIPGPGMGKKQSGNHRAVWGTMRTSNKDTTVCRWGNPHLISGAKGYAQSN